MTFKKEVLAFLREIIDNKVNNSVIGKGQKGIIPDGVYKQFNPKFNFDPEGPGEGTWDWAYEPAYQPWYALQGEMCHVIIGMVDEEGSSPWGMSNKIQFSLPFQHGIFDPHYMPIVSVMDNGMPITDPVVRRWRGSAWTLTGFDAAGQSMRSIQVNAWFKVYPGSKDFDKGLG